MSRSTSVTKPSAGTDKATGPGRPKDLSKRAAILGAAKHLFVGQGYLSVSMDQIATEAGVSKLTVYSHFGDKETLFSEAIRSKCVELLPADLFATPPQGSLREQLLTIARAFFTLVGSEESLAMHRMMLGPQTEQPLRQMFWQSGPQVIHEALTEFLREHMASGELQVDDLDRAAHQFFVLVKGHLHNSMLCCLVDEPSQAEIDAHLQATVDFFLRAYAPR